MGEASDLAARTSEVVAAYLKNAGVRPGEIGSVIQTVHAALASVSEEPKAEPEPPTTKATPSQIRKSITPSGLVSFEDGKTYQSLKRNLTTRGMTPDDYRTKWGLPRDYPMVSPGYSARRSKFAKSIGLGSKGRGASKAASAAEPIAPAAKASTTSTKKLAPGLASPKRAIGDPVGPFPGGPKGKDKQTNSEGSGES